MAICSCGLPAHCCQPAVAGSIIYSDLRSELSTHLAYQALFTQSSPVHKPATSFPLSKHTGGGDTAPAFSGLRVCLQLTWEMGLPPLLWSFPPTATFTSFPTPECWACAAAPAGWCVCLQLRWEVDLPPSPVEFSSLRHSHKLSRSWLLGVLPCSRWSLSSQAWLVYLQFQEGFPSPPLWHSVHPTLFATCLYCSYCLLLSFSFFPRGEVGLSRGLC
jgi:hypothetical protein